jgi:hypothetical protein
MTKSVALLYVAFAGVVMLGQTLSPGKTNSPVGNREVNRLEQLSKRFPPEVVLPVKASGAAGLTQSYCVHPSLDSNSLSISPCRTSARKARLLPLFERVAPTIR